VDTPVRGFVYEAGGTLDAEVREAGVSAVRAAEARWHVRVAVVHADPRERAAWLGQMTGAVNGVLG
jgi:hypothetical protein